MSGTIESRLSKLKQEMDEAKQQVDRLTGRKEALLQELKRLGFDSPAAAAKAVTEMREALRKQEDALVVRLCELERRYGLTA